MRDPYDPWADERTQSQPGLADIAETEAIRTCTHCDHQGIRPNGLTCRHIDHAQAARKGLAAIRAQMGWNTTAGTNHTRNPLKTAPRGSWTPKTTHVTHPHTPKTPTHQPNHTQHHQHPQPRKSTTMPPVMNRQGSNQRAEKAWQLHIAGRTWREVAEATGFNSPQSAQKAATAWLKKNPPDNLEIARRANGDGIRQVRGILMQTMAKAQARGEHRTVSELGRAVLDSFEKEAKLWGLFIVVPEEVNVNVTTAVAVLERAEAELLALAASGRSAISAQPVIDAEVVEP